MADSSQGFIGGFIGGQEAQQNHTINDQTIQKNNIDLQKEQMAIKATQQTLDQQRTFLQKIHDLNSGPSASDPGGQVQQMASMMFGYAEAANATGMTEAAAKYAKDGAGLLENGAKIDASVAKQNIETAKMAGGLMDWVSEGKTPHEQQDRWNKSLMVWQNTTGKPSPYAQKPFSLETVNAIKSAATSRMDQEKLKLDAADEKLKAAQTRSADAAAAQHRAGAALDKARETALGKVGGTKATKAEQQQVDLQNDTVNDIDHMIDQLDTMKDDPTGLKGHYHHFMEFAGSVTGTSSKTDVTKFQQDVDALRLKLPRALGTRSYTSKATQEIVNKLADLSKPGTSRETATAKLQELRDMLSAAVSKSPVKPTGEQSVMSAEDYIKQFSSGTSSDGSNE
jgi:hypothetical protein